MPGMSSTKYQKWSDQEKHDLSVKWLDENKPIAQIARELNRTPESVDRARRRFGFPDRNLEEVARIRAERNRTKDYERKDRDKKKKEDEVKKWIEENRWKSPDPKPLKVPKNMIPDVTVSYAKTCQYVIEQKVNGRMCNKPSEYKSYCLEHARMCFVGFKR